MKRTLALTIVVALTLFGAACSREENTNVATDGVGGGGTLYTDTSVTMSTTDTSSTGWTATDTSGTAMTTDTALTGTTATSVTAGTTSGTAGTTTRP